MTEPFKMFRPVNNNGNSCWVWAADETQAREVFLQARYVRSLAGIRGCPVSIVETSTYPVEIDGVPFGGPLKDVTISGIVAMRVSENPTWLLYTKVSK